MKQKKCGCGRRTLFPFFWDVPIESDGLISQPFINQFQTIGRGRFTILISSAASFDPKQDVSALALRELDAAAVKNIETLLTENAAWWHNFWARGFVHLHSVDGQADFVEQNYTYFLYLMDASSRGNYPPRFGGMLWYTNGDMRRWGSQYWWANTSAYYNNLMPANRLELMDPMFSMYSGMLESCAVAARQQWGSQGIWIPEITFFNGLEKLPEDIAAELQDLVLVRKPYKERSARFQWFVETKNRHHARCNFQADGHYIVPTKGGARSPGDGGVRSEIFGHCTHILSVGSAQRNGKILVVEIQSQSGGACRLINPWKGADVTLYRGGKRTEDLS